MRHPLAFMTLLALTSSLSLALPACPQSVESPSGQSAANQPGTVSPPIQVLVTGCLRRGNDGGYYLNDHNGNTWELSSKIVDLAGNVNHAVTLTGRPGPVSKPQESPSQPSSRPQTGGNLHNLQVLTLKMLSNSCTR